MNDLFDRMGIDQPPIPTHLYRANDPITSIEAAESFEPTKVQKMVLDAIRTLGDCIYIEVLNYCEIKYGRMSSSTVSSRFNELEKKGLIEFTGEKRVGRSGRQQRVMRAIAEAPLLQNV